MVNYVGGLSGVLKRLGRNPKFHPKFLHNFIVHAITAYSMSIIVVAIHCVSQAFCIHVFYNITLVLGI